jgi:hypothetical protein
MKRRLHTDLDECLDLIQSIHFGQKNPSIEERIYWRASTLVLRQLADFRLMCHRLRVLSTTLELDMANPKELQEAAEAIRNVRRLPAVQRHRQLEDLLQRAEERARKELSLLKTTSALQLLNFKGWVVSLLRPCLTLY